MAGVPVAAETPAAIDTRLADAEYTLMGIYMRIEAAKKGLARFAESVEKIGRDMAVLRHGMVVEASEKYLAEAPAALAPHLAVRAECAAEYKRRGGWSRYFLVTNTGGHVHKTRCCTTCFLTTCFAWLPGASGHDGKGLIEMFGSKVCTVCFPEAPIGDLEAAEKAAKKAAEKAAGFCEGHGRMSVSTEGARYYIRRGTCPVCSHTVGVTSTGKVRKHRV